MVLLSQDHYSTSLLIKSDGVLAGEVVLEGLGVGDVFTKNDGLEEKVAGVLREGDTCGL